MFYIFFVSMCVVSSLAGMENKHFVPCRWEIVQSCTTHSRKNTLNIIYDELDRVTAKLERNRSFLPALKYQSIISLIEASKNVAGNYHTQVELDPYCYDQKAVDSFIMKYLGQEAGLTKAINELEDLIPAFTNQELDELDNTLASLALDTAGSQALDATNDPLDTLIAGLSAISFD